jgi:hypothetical protein
MDAQGGEGRNLDYKLTFDPDDARAKTALVKDLVAMANSGGGRIVFGRDETSIPGIPPKLAEALDGAKILDYVERYVEKGLIHLRHIQKELPQGNVLLTLIVEPASYPVVMKRDGNWSGFSSKNDRALFRRGDVWVRHGSKTERISQADMRAFIQAAYDSGVERVLSAARIVRQAGPGAPIDFLVGSGDVVRGPIDLLNLALSRKRLGLPHILSREELLWLFLSRRSFKPKIEQLELIIESALRRPPTLFWWLLDARADVDLIKRILFRLPEAQDRDKSDAGSSAVELAGLYLEEKDASRLMQLLGHSRYAHIKNAAADYLGKRAVKQNFIERAKNARHEEILLADMSDEDLEELAHSVAQQLFRGKSSSGSRTLANATRVLWARKRGWLSAPKGKALGRAGG